MPDQTNQNVYELGAFSADQILTDISDLRERIVDAWRERAVMLTKDEQKRLIVEIKATCDLLGALTP
jgi:hypothetical protein